MKRQRKRSDQEGPDNDVRLSNFSVIPDGRASNNSELATRTGAVLFILAGFILCFALVCGLCYLINGRIDLLALIIALIIALIVPSAVHIAQQWEKVVVLRLGSFSRVRGPGLFFTIPLLESCTMRVDSRVRTTPFGAEETLTSDLVPLNVNAVLFWHIWDAKLACLEVADFVQAIELAAQTALRDAIGRSGVAEVAIRRKQLDKELEGILNEKVAPWGITILSVEIRDILMPKELQDVMSQEAQAEQRKKARIILMEAEQDISEMLAEMGDTYASHNHALQLRMMHLLYESVRDTGGTVVIPSDFSEAFRDIDTGNLGKVFK
jgi:regulator of protease activity HflC (stomatin/prohibitin superfamily)